MTDDLEFPPAAPGGAGAHGRGDAVCLKPEPVSLRDLAERLPQGADPAEAVARLRRRYEGRGVELARVGEAFAFRTAPDLSFLMQTETVETRRLSRAATETLAIIAYHQPVTRAEIEEIRGVAAVSRDAGPADRTGLGAHRPSPHDAGAAR